MLKCLAVVLLVTMVRWRQAKQTITPERVIIVNRVIVPILFQVLVLIIAMLAPVRVLHVITVLLPLANRRTIFPVITPVTIATPPHHGAGPSLITVV